MTEFMKVEGIEGSIWLRPFDIRLVEELAHDPDGARCSVSFHDDRERHPIAVVTPATEVVAMIEKALADEEDMEAAQEFQATLFNSDL